MELTIKILLGLVTLSVARPRTVYRFQGDNAEHWLEGAPGESVRGFYSWISPEGSEFYVKYIADQNGYRILDSNAVPADHSGVAADGNQVITELLDLDMVPLSHDGLAIFDSAKTEPEGQANLDSTNSLPSNNGNSDIAISQDEDDLSEAADKSSIENMESDPIPIDIADLIEEEQEESTELELIKVEQEESTQAELIKEEVEEPIESDSIPIDIVELIEEEQEESAELELIEEEQEESTQLPNTEDSEIIDNMLEAASTFGERTDAVVMVPNAAPIMDNEVAMSEFMEDVAMDNEVAMSDVMEPFEPIVIRMEIETMQRSGTKRTFAPIKMENGDLTFMEVKPAPVGHEGAASSSAMEACDLCEMQYDYDYNDDTIRV